MHLYTVDASLDSVLGTFAEGTELSVLASVDCTTMSSDSAVVDILTATTGCEWTVICVADSACMLEEPS